MPNSGHHTTPPGSLFHAREKLMYLADNEVEIRLSSVEAQALLDALPDDEHSPEFQEEYRRLWYREAGVRRCNAAMPGGTERQMCDRWPNHDGPHLNAETSSEWGKNAGQISAR